MATLNELLARLGYGGPERLDDDTLGYAPTGRNQVRCRYLSVRLGEGEVTLTGPRRVVSAVQRQLVGGAKETRR